MSVAAPSTTRCGRGARRWTSAGLLALGAVALGCSIEKHYRVLSFFFDGVPDPAVIAASRSEVERVRAAGGTVYTHEPYGQEQCDACHKTPAGRMLTKVTSAACKRCHEDVAANHRFVHGPVAISACLWCHAPHESTTPSLLRLPPATLCRQCHDTSLSTQRTVPEHTDMSRSCLECHSGHGGSERYFLKTPPPAAPVRWPGREGPVEGDT